jgi:hypothetical protein
MNKLFKIALSFKNKLVENILPNEYSFEKAKIAKNKLKEKLGRQPFLNGIGIGCYNDNAYFIKVNLSTDYLYNTIKEGVFKYELYSQKIQSIPYSVDNINVEIDWVENIVALTEDKEIDRTK